MSSTTKIILIVVGALAVLCCIAVIVILLVTGGGAFALFNTLKPVSDAGDSFMGALRDSNYKAAYEICSPALQKELGTSENLRKMIEENNVKPVKWNFNSTDMKNENGELKGTVTLTENRAGSVHIYLVKTPNGWKIKSFNINEE